MNHTEVRPRQRVAFTATLRPDDIGLGTGTVSASTPQFDGYAIVNWDDGQKTETALTLIEPVAREGESLEAIIARANRIASA